MSKFSIMFTVSLLFAATGASYADPALGTAMSSAKQESHPHAGKRHAMAPKSQSTAPETSPSPSAINPSQAKKRATDMLDPTTSSSDQHPR